MKAFICLLSVSLMPLAGCVVGYDTANVERIPSPVEDTLQRAVDNEHRVGIAIGLVNPNGRYFSAHGVNDISAAEPFSQHSQVATGSVTKVFTAEVLAALAMENRVDLNQELFELWPGHARPGGIQLGYLATHRAGLPRDIPVAALQHNDATPLLDLLGTDQVLPAEYEYSNAGMALLGLALEETTGRSLDELVASRVAGPLVLANTGYVPNADLLAQPHEGLEPITGDANRTPSVARGAGGLYASTAELLTFVERHLYPDSSQQKAWFDLALGKVSGTPLGWKVYEQNGIRIYHHGGDGNGYQAFIGFRTDNGVGVVLVSNSSADDDLQQVAQHLLMPDAVSLPSFDYPPAVNLSVAEMQPYLGRYHFVGDTNTVTISEQSGNMYYSEFTARGEEVRTARMYADREGGFYLRQIPLFFKFKVTSGKAVSARLRLGNNRFTMERIE
ncbi:serine hydrolase domain-containing protein [Saccharospirillum impatiens]|uniref:serine hydrolase domain-containing protein n=1 Tax=Saccharospirillum impatiens TaxID=169438 RepID=UPI0003FC2A57|nr:serine hydrolase domain-containing protein [Saccharospirillum impatiens]